MLLMQITSGISFKNRRFLTLKPPLLTDETALFRLKNHRFLRENLSPRFKKRQNSVNDL